MGSVQVESSHCVDVSQQVNFYVSRGQMTLTGPDGGLVLADYAGFLTLLSAGAYAFEGNFYVTGGTGRYRDASGTGVLFGAGDLSTTWKLTADGRISY